MSYVLAQPKGVTRPLLLRLARQRGRSSESSLRGIVPDHTQYSDPQTYEISNKDIIIPLGDNPPYGTAYGVLIEPVEQQWVIRHYGSVYCYKPQVDEAVRARLEKSIVMALKRIRTLSPGFEVDDMITEIRNPRGIQTGCYAFRPKGHDVLTIRPFEGQGLRELVKVITHEMAHRVWFRTMTPEQRSTWIKLYARFVHVKVVSIADLTRILNSIIQMECIRDFLKEAEPEEQAAVAMYLGWLNKVRGISSKDTTDLIRSGIKPPLPDTHIHRSDTSPPITLYSRSSACELFAEAVSSLCIDALEDSRIKAMLGNLA